MSKYNYQIREDAEDKGFRLTIEAATEAEAEKTAYDMYPEATIFDLMAIIN